MQQLKDICTKPPEELIQSMRESMQAERKAMNQGRAVPNEHGNRKARRAAEAVARKERA